MPSKVVVERCIAQWGPAPHPETITEHLEKFKQVPYSLKKWLRQLGQDWVFHSVLPARGATPDTEIRRKVACRRIQTAKWLLPHTPAP